MQWSGKLVTIRKMKASDNPDFPSASPTEYEPGKINSGVSLPVDYVAVGKLIAEPTTGEPLRLIRYSRNGELSTGFLTTSVVENITINNSVMVVETKNSIYELMDTE